MDSFFNLAMVLSFLISLGAILRLHQVVKVGNARLAILSNLVKQGRSAEGVGRPEDGAAAQGTASNALVPTPQAREEEFQRIWAELARLGTLAEEHASLRAENALLEDRLETQLETESELIMQLAYKEDALRSSQSALEARTDPASPQVTPAEQVRGDVPFSDADLDFEK
jgi:hypothetical protein